MKPGEYTGKDGYKYRVYGIRTTVDLGDDDALIGHTVGVNESDITAAKAALDELIEAEAEEWVEIDAYHRIMPDGSKPQYLSGSGKWQPDTSNAQHFYRKGHSVALAQVQELLGPECGSCHARAKYDPELSHRCCIECPIQAVLALAKAVKS